jgi:hypothetical protein
MPRNNSVAQNELTRFAHEAPILVGFGPAFGVGPWPQKNNGGFPMFRFVTVSTFAAVALLATGCVSMSSLQTARTLEKNKSQQTLGGGLYTSESLVDDKDLGRISLPYLEYSYRQGLSDKIDAGIKITNSFTLMADGKYQLVDGEQFALAAGLGVGYFSVSQTSGDEKFESTLIDVMVPLYLSYDVTKSFTPYLSPKYIARFVSGTESSTNSLWGATAGAKIGDQSGAYVEATYLTRPGSNFSTLQYNVSFFWTPANAWFQL